MSNNSLRAIENQDPVAERRKLSLSQSIAVQAVTAEIQHASLQLQAAQAKMAELFAELGLDPAGTYAVTPDGYIEDR